MGDCPTKVTIPIVLLPGIMGSRLFQRAGGKAWDPDDPLFTGGEYAWNAGTSAPVYNRHDTAEIVRKAAARRKALLVGPKFTKNYVYVDEYNAPAELTFDQMERGWGMLVQSAYKPTLDHMSTSGFRSTIAQKVKETNEKFDLQRMTIYACGYNWTGSCGDAGVWVAERVRTYLDWERQWAAENDAECPGAILVTHSMGGLVARAACLQAGLASDVLAVLSTVMPTDGAAAAYKRFHFGFEHPTSGGFFAHMTYVVLGRQGQLVTALLGHMPGAQELLPNKRYRDNAGRERWLRVKNPERNRVGRWISGEGPVIELPQNGNPYVEIYQRKDRMYRAANPEWLFPDSLQNADPELDQFDEFRRINNIAKNWHDSIVSAGDFHDVTYLCHSDSSSYATYDRIEWEPDMFLGSLGRSVNDDDIDTSSKELDYRRENLIFGKEDNKHISGPIFRPDFKISAPTGAGDATVPISASVQAKLPPSRKTRHGEGYEHGAAIGVRVVLKWIQDRLSEVMANCNLY